MYFTIRDDIGTRVKIPAPWFDHRNAIWMDEPATGRILAINGPVATIEADNGGIYRVAVVSIQED